VPLPDDIRAALAAELAGAAYAKLTDAEAADLLNAPGPNVANPATRGQVPRELSASGLLALLQPEEIAGLFAWPSLPRLVDDINGQDRTAVLTWAGFLQLAGKISAETAAAVGAYVLAPVPDPSYPATVPSDSPRVRLFRTVFSFEQPGGWNCSVITPDNVAEARR
jgi:hypothetical protein